MWVLTWKKYALSKFATFVSIIGALMRYAGVLCLFAGLIPATLICIAIGIGLHFCAEAIAKNKAAKISGTAQNTTTPKAAATAAKTTTAQPSPRPVQANPTTYTTAQSTASNGKVRCAQCGTLISTTNKFCTECGKALAPEAPKQKKCLRCGASVTNGSKFCSNCGYEIK